MMGFMGITAFLSMWINSVASTALMLPIAQSVMESLKECELEAEENELQQNRTDEALQITDISDCADNAGMCTEANNAL